MRYFDNLDDMEAETPPIAGEADMEWMSRIEAARCTAEFAVPITTAVPQRDHRELPLFGGINQQEELF